jgi:hypothetical protein
MLIVCVLGCCLGVQGQDVKFERLTHDFGVFDEAKREVKCEFLYENTSPTEPAYLTGVSSSAKTLRFMWSRELLPSGGKGTITITLDAKDGNGKFNYPVDVKVRQNNKDQTYTLHVKGEIIPRVKTKAEIYPMKEGSLRYKSNYVRYEKIHPNVIKTDTFFFYNESDKTMKFSCNKSYLKSSVELISLPSELQPKEEGKLIFAFHAAKENEWGTFMERIRLETDDSLGKAKTLYISGEIYDDFDSWTPQQKENAPKIKVDSMEYDFEPVTTGTPVEREFVISNEGVDTLFLRKLKPTCSCTIAKPDKDKLAHGEQTSVKVTLNTSGKTGMQHRTVDIISNDPVRPKITLQIKGNVVAAAENPTGGQNH